MSRDFRYRAFGLVIRSPLPLWPEANALADTDLSPDIDVVFGGPVARSNTLFSLSSDRTETFIPGFGSIVVQGGARIEVSGEAGLDGHTLAASATGPGLAMALQQRGALVVHGSCIAIGAHAICIAGPSGAGKSTIAGAALRRGHALVSDGMTAVFMDAAGTAAVAVGPRCARLWPDAADHLGFDTNSLPRVLPLHEKRVCSLPETNRLGAFPLCCVLETGPGPEVALQPLAGSPALMTLVRNSFLADYLDAEGAALLLTQCGRVCEQVRVGRLSRGNSLSDLDAVIQALECWADSDSVSAATGAAEAAPGR